MRLFISPEAMVDIHDLSHGRIFTFSFFHQIKWNIIFDCKHG